MSQLSPQAFKLASEFLSDQQKALIFDVQLILNRLQISDHISDYSFIVSPVSKAYEGYLKDFFLKIRIINKMDYNSDRFRVGKTLNPSLRYKRFSIFQKLININENGEELAESLWNAWKYGRNEIFHYFPGKLKNIDRADAEERIAMLLDAIIKSGEFLENHTSSADGLL
ncbi:hypothetical protein KBC75_03850 [Candidatus Shapirobacteria bacterium]|nr:hypothetical protein [Candidatus Shapirobacteria bacterium]